MHRPSTLAVGLIGAVLLAGCSAEPPAIETAQSAAAIGARIAVRDTQLAAVIEVAGTVEPVQQATLSTRVMATVEAVLVHEGDRVVAGAVLARLDTRDL
ncbi:MAG: biotin/lipoyl-binding protein, partial [Gemmatimonadota bacterium]|nr:biotin/lipoyl-binding protein [Gemmatimonadota bacterium]